MFANVNVEKSYALNVVFASRLSKEKGVTLLYEAAKLLPDYSFVVAGSGPDGECLNDVPNITMKGFLTGDELTTLMANAKVMLLPSVWYENCPLSILEAQAMGVPVVTMNNGGMAELVKDGVTGTLISQSTPESIALKLKEVMENEEYYQTLKSNCKKEKDHILSVETYCDILMKEYEKLIAR